MKYTSTTTLSILTALLLGLAFPLCSFAESDEFVTVLGRVDTGVILYSKTTKQPWGVITDVPEWGKVTVARIDSSSSGSGRVSGTVTVYDRDYITSNYVTKAK